MARAVGVAQASAKAEGNVALGHRLRYGHIGARGVLAGGRGPVPEVAKAAGIATVTAGMRGAFRRTREALEEGIEVIVGTLRHENRVFSKIKGKNAIGGTQRGSPWRGRQKYTTQLLAIATLTPKAAKS